MLWLWLFVCYPYTPGITLFGLHEMDELDWGNGKAILCFSHWMMLWVVYLVSVDEMKKNINIVDMGQTKSLHMLWISEFLLLLCYYLSSKRTLG